MKMPRALDTLDNRILLLTAGLALAVSCTVLFTMWVSMVRDAEIKSERDIERAQTVVNQVLGQRMLALRSSAEVLTENSGFKQAMLTADAGTIERALHKHGGRIQADLMLLLNLDGSVIAASNGSERKSLALFTHYPQLPQKLVRDVGVVHTTFDGLAYQMIILPIRTSQSIALAAIGFQLDTEFAQQLQRLAGTHITLLQRSTGGHRVLVSTLSQTEAARALAAPDHIEAGLRLPFLTSQRYLSQLRVLDENLYGDIHMYLSVDLKETFASYDLLRNSLLLINSVTLLLAILGSVVLSRTLSNPLARLEDAVRGLALGQRDTLSQMGSATSEIKSLFNSFNRMQTDLEAREAQVRYQASHDTLTELLIRSSFIDQVAEYIEVSPESLAIANINIRSFKNINDTFGPLVGDDCLRLLAQRLRAVAPDGKLVARCGADEFFLALPMHHDQDPEALFRRALNQLIKPYEFVGLKIQLQFNLGISVFPRHGVEANQLIRRSTIALDEARQKKLDLCLYQDGREETLLDQLTLLEDLKQALQANDGQLCMNYQPKQNLATGEVDKCEALIRWIHPQRGYVSPELFVALAEQSGLISNLTDWVIDAVVADICSWKDSGIQMHVAINISAQDLERDNLVDKVCCLLRANRLATSGIIFELTERDMMNDADKALHLLQRFRKEGFQLSVDDYGIGQSSLSKLRQMPVDEIKIDKSFVLNLNTSESDRIIVKSTIELGHNFQLRVIAEGVENEESKSLLQTMGCDYIQGFLLARPMPAGDLCRWVQKNSPALYAVNSPPATQDTQAGARRVP